MDIVFGDYHVVGYFNLECLYTVFNKFINHKQ